MNGRRSAFKMLIVKLIGNKHIGRPRCGLEDNIRTSLKEIGVNSRNCIDSAEDRDYWRAFVNAALNLRVP